MVKFHTVFAKTHGIEDRVINQDSVELRFLRHICQGGSDVAQFFNPQRIDKRDVTLYTPATKYTGLAGIEAFAKQWLSQLNATSATVHPVVQTVAGGRSVSEVEIWFDVGDSDEPYKMPLSIFADLAHNDKMEGVRIYYFYQWIPGTPAYNKPIFPIRHKEIDDSCNLTGVVKYYYEQLHNPYSDKALDNVVNMMSAEKIRFGGYRPTEVAPPLLDIERFRDKYVRTLDKIPGEQCILFKTVTDDGCCCMVEWTSLVRRVGLAKGWVSQAGMVAYERDMEDPSKLVSIRICDNWGWETEIDYDTVLPEDQYIDLD